MPLNPGAQSTDYSLQLAGGIANFYAWKCEKGGVFLDNPNACQQVKNLRLKLTIVGLAVPYRTREK